MKNLLIDIGNSRIKIAVSSGNRIRNARSYDYTEKSFRKKLAIILKYKRNDFDLIGISCLNERYRVLINQIIFDKYSLTPFFISYDKGLPIKIDYEKSLGNDRICSSIAAREKYRNKKNILIIDFGTATTYNLVSGRTFIGGIITPGIMTSHKSLNIMANLPLAEIVKVRDLITNKTKANIISGVIHQSLFTTESIIKILKKKYRNLFVISTGGLSELIYRKSCLIDKNDRNLVLEGINYILAYNYR